MWTGRARACLALLTLTCSANAFIAETVEVITMSKIISENIVHSWEALKEIANATEDANLELPTMWRQESEVLSRLAEISSSIDRLELGLEKAGAVAMLLTKTNGRGTRLELRLHELADLLGRIDNIHRLMKEYVHSQEKFERSTLEGFATLCVSLEPGALPELLERIHSLIVPPGNHLLGRGLMQLTLLDLQEGHPDLCDLQLSPHQLIYDMYNTISLTEIKGYAMMQFSWMLLRVYGEGKFTQEARLATQRYAERTVKTAEAAREALVMARRDLYRCDPPHHQEGGSYAEVTRLLQGYIENEVDMNGDGTCKHNCAYYTVAENHGCFKDQYCARQPTCTGRILNCQYIDSDMWICPANRSTHRRYDWIQYENGRQLAPFNSCSRGYTKVDSWWRWLFWHCSYCMCLCDEAGPRSDRYFSLREATSSAGNNKVVTGARLVKLGRVFHLQVSEGTLKERGKVENSRWVKVQRFDPNDSNVKDGKDFHTLTYVKRAIDLDELDSPDGHILTGLRFRMLGSHLHFEIRSTPFNYTTGHLAADQSRWIGNDNTVHTKFPRSRLELQRPDIPTRDMAPLPVDSKHDQYVEFTNTDLDADAAQSTVPFIDIQPVEPLKGGGLNSGAGIIHRGARRSGGYIALKLLTYDYSKHVKAEAPPSDFSIEVDYYNVEDGNDGVGDVTEVIPVDNTQ